MIISMNRQIFESLANEDAGHTCFEPIVREYQSKRLLNSGDNIADFKSKFLKSLTKGQRALFMFFVYYDHAIKSKNEFQQFNKYFLDTPNIAAVKAGVKYFNDDAMFEFITKLEALGTIEYNDFDTRYNLFYEISTKTLNIIGSYIKSNPLEFIVFDE